VTSESVTSATVTQTVFLGSSMHVQMRLDNGECAAAQVPHDAATFAEGERVYVAWNKSDELRFDS
jgi:hypothetical protein